MSDKSKASMEIFGITRNIVEAMMEYAARGDPETSAPMTLAFICYGHSGPGFYIWDSEYPEDGCEFLGVPTEESDLHYVSKVEVMPEKMSNIPTE